MPDFYSFLQTVYHGVRALAARVTKRMYRTAAVLVSACAVITVVAFTSSGFAGAGRNAAACQERGEEEADAQEGQTEEEIGMEALTGLSLTASTDEPRRWLGRSLERTIQDELAQSALEIEAIEKEVLMQTQQAEKEAEEKARRERAVISYTEEDYQVLLRIVQAEAGICDDKGKILVANVIINRVRSDEFPDTITGVVYEKSQFSPVLDGTIDTCQVTENTIECVNRALAGEDYSQGALYFMNRVGSASSNVRWFDGRLTFLMSHGGHEFFK